MILGLNGTLSTSEVTNVLGESQVEVTANTVAGNFSVLAALGEFSITANLENIADVASQFLFSEEGSFVGGIGEFTSEFRTAGVQSMTVTDSLNRTLSATQPEITVDASIAEKLEIVSGDGRSAVIGTRFDEDLAVQVRDRFDNPIIGEPVSFVVPDVGASARLSQSRVLTDAMGQAATDAIANDEIGDYAVQVSAFKLLETLRLSNTELIDTSPANPSLTSPSLTSPAPTSPVVEPILEQDSVSLLEDNREANPGRIELFDEYAFAQLEQSLSEEYTRYWQMPPVEDITLERVQTILQQAESTHKSRTAVVYVIFVPASDQEASNSPQSALLSSRILNDETSRDTDQLLLVVIPPKCF